MASPNLTTDCTAIVQFPVVKRTGYAVELTVFEDDATQSRISSDTKHQRIRLQFRNQSDSQKSSFETFIDARILSGTFFYWNDVRAGINDIKVKVFNTEIAYSCVSPRTWDWELDLIVVLS